MTEPKDPSPPAMPLDPVVKAFAARVKASSLPEARALVPLTAAARSALVDQLLGPAEDADAEEAENEGAESPGEASDEAPKRPDLRLVPSPASSEAPSDLGWRTRAIARLKVGSLISRGQNGLPRADESPEPANDSELQQEKWSAASGMPPMGMMPPSGRLPPFGALPPPVDSQPSQVSASPKNAPPPRRWWPMALVAALGVLVPALVWFQAWIPSTAAVAYDLRAEGDMPVRGDTPPPADAPLHLRPSTRLHVVLTPQKPFADAALRMLVVRDGKARLLRPPYENDGQGKLTIDRSAREALGDQVDGPAELVWVLGRLLPDDAAIERIALDHGTVSPPWGVIVRRAVVFQDWGGALRIAPGDIEFAGCKAMIRGPRCEMDPGSKLVLWAPWEAGEAQVQADGQPVKTETIAAAGGTRWTVTVGAGTRQITFSSTHLESPFQLAMADAPGVPAITEAARLVDENRLPDAEKALAAMTDATPYAKLATTRQRARIARRQGDLDRAESLYREAVSQASAAGRLSDELENRHLLALLAMTQHRDHTAAERELEAARALEAQCPPWQVDGAYYRGTLAEERGRYAEALAAFTDVRRSAARLDLTDMERIVLQPLAEMLSVWGRDEEAIGLLQRAYSLTPDRPCERGEVLTNWAWAEHRAADTRVAHEVAASHAEQALRALGGSACGTALATAQMNAALTAAAVGRTRDARIALDRIVKSGSSNARMAPWTARLELELDRAEDPARALATAARLEREMAQSPLPEMAFEAALGRATALDALNRPEEASAAYEEASRRETAWGAAAPLGEGRSLFFERQRSSFRAWVDFAVRRAEKAPTDPGSQRAAALFVGQIVRQSLGRFFATLLPLTTTHAAAGASLAPPPEGEVHLYYHPLQEGWIAVAVSSAGAAGKRLPGLAKGTSADLSAALLAPFKEVLAGARRVVVFADRALRDVEIENLPWNGGVLSDQVIVTYGVGGQALTAARSEACGSKPFALLVLDPSRNLAGARRAGDRIAARLGAGAAVLTGESATRRAVLEALGDPCTRLFQYDGHAVFGGKKDGIEAALSLADGPLSLSMLLDPTVLPHVPDLVVLSGCETAREEGLGIAHAFLERGSRQVLATTAKVDDALSARLMETLYEQDPRAAAEWDLAAALRTALRSLRGPGRGAGPWAAFRVLVP